MEVTAWVVGFAFGLGQPVQGYGLVQGFGGLLFASGLESREFGFIAIEGAAETAFIECEEAERLALVEPGLGGAEEVGDDFAGLEAGGGIEGEEAFLDGVSAMEAPDAGGDLVGERGFEGAGGLVVFADFGVVVAVGFGFVVGQDEDLAGESVAEGVETGAGLSGVGARAGGA